MFWHDQSGAEKGDQVHDIRLYGLKELQDISGVPMRSWRGFIAAGLLRASRIGRRLCVERADLIAFINANKDRAHDEEARTMEGATGTPEPRRGAGR
jgi:hypothetical protein